MGRPRLAHCAHSWPTQLAHCSNGCQRAVLGLACSWALAHDNKLGCPFGKPATSSHGSRVQTVFWTATSCCLLLDVLQLHGLLFLDGLALAVQGKAVRPRLAAVCPRQHALHPPPAHPSRPDAQGDHLLELFLDGLAVLVAVEGAKPLGIAVSVL